MITALPLFGAEEPANPDPTGIFDFPELDVPKEK